MAKNRIGRYVFLIGVCLAIIWYLKIFTTLFSTVIFEDYLVYDDRSNQPYLLDSRLATIGNPLWTQIGGSDNGRNAEYVDNYYRIEVNINPGTNGLLGDYYIRNTNNKVYFGTSGGYSGSSLESTSSIRITTLKNFKGQNFKISTTCGGSECSNTCRSGGAGLEIGNLITSSDEVTLFTSSCSSSACYPQSMDTAVEMFSSKLDPNIANIYVNGIFSRTLNFTGLGNVNITLEVSGPGSWCYINSFGYQVPFSCVQGDGELLAEETFVGPTQLGLYDTNYPVTKFCLAHPAIITRESESGSSTTAEIYRRLARGEVMNIPAGDTWTLFYIFYSKGIIPCDNRSAWNGSQCVGLVKFCGGGEYWDRSLGVCVALPSSNFSEKCGLYARYDVQEEECVLDFPQIGLCPAGNYNAKKAKCEIPPEQGGGCIY